MINKFFYWISGAILIFGLISMNRKSYGDSGFEGAARLESGSEFDGTLSSVAIANSNRIFASGNSRACIIVTNSSYPGGTRISLSSAPMDASVSISSYTLALSSYPASSIMLGSFRGALWAQALDAVGFVSVAVCKTTTP